MEKAYQFDFVHDTQSIFRCLLNAFSHPARQYCIADEAKGLPGNWAVLSAVGATLLDNEMSFYVEKTPELHTKLIDLTLARPEELTKAQYIFLSSAVNYVNIETMFKTARRGTLADPQTSALFIVQCGTFSGNAALSVVGPGIDGETSLRTTEYIKNILQIRQKENIEYPCGVDLLFVTSFGEIMAFPRLCRVAE